MSPDLVIVRTGTANLASVIAAFRRLGREPIVTENPRFVEQARHVVLPGVGSFGAAMHELTRAGLLAPIVARVNSNRPLLGICLGMQLLCESSEESPNIRGLAVIPAHIRRFSPQPGLRIPHFGWNVVSGSLPRGYAYFAHSYRLDAAPPGWDVATTPYGGTFISALRRGNILACQFHPELSGQWGSDLIQSWLGGSAC